VILTLSTTAEPLRVAMVESPQQSSDESRAVANLQGTCDDMTSRQRLKRVTLLQCRCRRTPIYTVKQCQLTDSDTVTNETRL